MPKAKRTALILKSAFRTSSASTTNTSQIETDYSSIETELSHLGATVPEKSTELSTPNSTTNPETVPQQEATPKSVVEEKQSTLDIPRVNLNDAEMADI